MNSKKLKSKYSKCSILIISLCIIWGAISACLPFSISLPDKLDQGDINNTAMDITTNASDGFGEFKDGYSYVYTDVNLIDKYRANDLDTPYDLSKHKVTSSSARGTYENPYVITNVTQWNNFASNATSASTTGKVYILGQDIDFDGQTFNAVENFNGKFYGLGNTLFNIKKDFGSENECGVFRIIGADSSVTDFNLQNVSITTTGGRVGTLIGSTQGGDILNCHVVGSVSGSADFSGNNSYVVGGLVGNASGDNQKIYIYRCSIKVKITLQALSGVGGGIILGGFSCTGGGLSTAIYDCVAIADVTCNSSSRRDIWYGGITCYTSLLGEQFIENCVVYTNYTDNVNERRVCASFINAWPNALPKLTLKNTYADGIFNQGSSKYGFMSAIWCTNYPVVDTVVLDTDNLNWFADNSISIGLTSGAIDLYSRRAVSSNKYTGATGLTQDDMYAKLQREMPSKIWAQKNVVTTEYITNTDIDSTEGYTIDNSPVRNYLVATVTFKNLLSGDKEEDIPSIPTDNYMKDDELPNTTNNSNFANYVTTSKPNHVFKGWTMDKSGNS
ncbi:MAG: hypothetical protein OSJ74_06475, partial [Clostridia bacterium]|nr:hypothetical protein [Clostridia bacterium]